MLPVLIVHVVFVVTVKAFRSLLSTSYNTHTGPKPTRPPSARPHTKKNPPPYVHHLPAPVDDGTDPEEGLEETTQPGPREG